MTRCQYLVIVSTAGGEKLYLEAFNADGSPKFGPRRLALQADFDIAMQLADKIRLSNTDYPKITIAESCGES